MTKDTELRKLEEEIKILEEKRDSYNSSLSSRNLFLFSKIGVASLTMIITLGISSVGFLTKIYKKNSGSIVLWLIIAIILLAIFTLIFVWNKTSKKEKLQKEVVKLRRQYNKLKNSR